MLKKRLLSPLFLTAVCVFLFGWFTSLQWVARNALLSIAAIALLPFLLLAALFFMVVVITAVSTLSGDGADLSHNVDIPNLSFIARYYRFWANQKNPAVWGVIFGVFLGAMLLWLAWGILAWPKESRTAEILSGAKQEIEAYYKSNNGYPPPTEAGNFSTKGATLADGFGRPVLYKTSGAWKLSSYKLRSLGYDGERSGDDICITGSTKAAEVLSEAADIASGVLSLTGSLSTGDSLSVLKNLQCNE